MNTHARKWENHWTGQTNFIVFFLLLRLLTLTRLAEGRVLVCSESVAVVMASSPFESIESF